MKKIIALLFSLVLISSLLVPAFASDGIQVTSETFNVVYEENSSSLINEADIAAMKDFSITDYIVDDADILTDSEELGLAQYFAAITAARRFAVIAVTKPYITGSIESYTDDLYDYGGYGYGSDHAGVMLLLDMSERAWHITTTGDDYIEDFQKYIDLLSKRFISGLRGSDDYYNGFYSFGECVDEIFCGMHNDIKAPVAFGLSLPKFIIISFIVGLVLALLVVKSMKSKNKSVIFSSGANYYQKNGSFTLRAQNERFLYHTITRTKIESKSSSGGGGIHTGSSGTSHGGGSGHF